MESETIAWNEHESLCRRLGEQWTFGWKDCSKHEVKLRNIFERFSQHRPGASPKG